MNINLCHSRIDEIRDNLYKLSQSEYEINGYTANKTSAKALKNPDGIKEKDAELDVKNLQYKVNNMVHKNNRRRNKNAEKYAELEKANEKNYMDNTSLDIYNVIDDSTEYLEWRKLDDELKMEMLDEYFAEFKEEELSDDIKDKLRQLVEDKEIVYKKDINYDKINKRILEITLLKKVNDEYVLQEDIKKVNVRRQNKTNINKILKKI